MKILLTGATGFLGGHLLEKLLESGYQIRALVRKKSALKGLKDNQVELFKGDLGDKKTLQGIMDGIDVVIHAGACTGGSWQDYQKSTIDGTKHILELANSSSVKKVIYVSSIDVYGINRVGKDALVNEATPIEQLPGNVGFYAKSKIISERLVEEFRKKAKFEIAVVRPGIIYGPGRATSLLPHIGFSLLGGKLFLKIGKGRKFLPLTYVDNTTAAIVELFVNKNANGQIYNIIDPKKIKQKEYLEYYFKLKGIRSIKIPIPYSIFLGFAFLCEKLARVPGIGKYFGLTRYKLNAKFKRVQYDGSKIMRQLNWSPPVKLEEGLRKYLA